MIRRPPRSTQSRSSAASDVYKRQDDEDSKAVAALLRKHQVADEIANWLEPYTEAELNVARQALDQEMDLIRKVVLKRAGL